MRKRSVIIAVFIIAICLLTACGAKSPSEKVVKDIIQSNNLNVLSNAHTNYYGDPIVFNIENINIELQQDNDKQSTVKCKLSLDNADYSATVYYTLDLVYYDKGGWVLNNVYEYNDYELLPKHGYVAAENDPNAPLNLMYSYLEGIDMPYNEVTATPSDSSDSSVGADIYYYINYTGESQTCAYSGSAYAYYSFNSRSGQWELYNFDTSSGYNITDWYLNKSIKCSDMNSGTVYMRISDVDLLNYTATAEYYHTNEYRGNCGVIQSTQVSITTPSNSSTSLYFSPIAVYYEPAEGHFNLERFPYTRYYQIKVDCTGFQYLVTTNYVANDLDAFWQVNRYGNSADIVDSF